MRTDTGRGTIFDNTVHIPRDDTALSAVLPALIALDDTKERLGAIMKTEALGEALATTNDGRTAVMMAKTAFIALLNRKREALEADRRALDRKPSDSDSEYRGLWRSLDGAGQAQRLNVASVEELGAVHALPDVANVAAELRGPLRERFMRENFVDRSALAGSYPARPSLSGTLLATGVDQKALDAAADTALDAHKQRLGQTEQDEQTIRDLIKHLAATFDTTPQAVLERVLP